MCSYLYPHGSDSAVANVQRWDPIVSSRPSITNDAVPRKMEQSLLLGSQLR